MKTTFLHALADQIWKTWRDDADFQQLFAHANQRDFGSLFDQPMDITAAECPLVSLRLASADFSTWANNSQLAVPVVFTLEAWLADDKQERIIEAFATMATPLANAYVSRFGLAWIASMRLGQAQFQMAPDLADTVKLGVLAGVRVPLTIEVYRDVRSNGLYL